MLLFLKNIESIYVYEKKSLTDRNPEQLLQIRIVPEFLDTLNVSRQEFQNKVRENTSRWMKNDAVKSVYPLAVEVTGSDGNNGRPSSVSHWIVSQYHAGKEEAAKCKVEKELGYLPIVGTAIKVDTGDEDLCMTEPKGHVFCFLPLPLEKKSPTGLRFHVHGCFAIDQNRRHIKWPTADQTGELKDPALLWNCFLVNVVLPKAMTELVTFIVNLQRADGRVAQLIPTAMKQTLNDKTRGNKEFLARLVYAILPDSTAVTPQWKTSSKEFTDDLLKGRTYFFAPVNNCWLPWNEAIFDSLDSSGRTAQLLRSVLYEDRQKLVCVPSYVLSLLPERAVRITAEHVAASLKKVQSVMKLSDDDRRMLLDYLIGELKGLNHLVDLHLLPLTDGSWTTFKTRSRTMERIYFGSKDHPQSLLPGLEERFVDVKFLRKKCAEIAQITQLTQLDAEAVGQMLPIILQPWRGADELSTIDASRKGLTRDWLREMWRYLCKHFPSDLGLQRFEFLHLIPQSNNVLVPLDKNQPLLARRASSLFSFLRLARSLPSDVATVCNQVGLRIIDDVDPDVANHPQIWNHYILPPIPQGFLEALTKLQTKLGKQTFLTRFSAVSDDSRRRLREFLASDIKRSLLSDGTRQVLRSLPIFFTKDGSARQKSHCVSAEEVSLAASTDKKLTIPVACSRLLLNLEDNASAVVAESLSIRPLSVQDILATVYFPAVINDGYYSNDEVENLMKFVCENLKEFERSSYKQISRLGGQVKFLKTADNRVVRPCDLFDPHEVILKNVFVNEFVFPVGEFSKPRYRDSLLLMGLKTVEEISPADVLMAATKLSSSTDTKRKDTATSLMILLNRQSGLLTQNSGLSEQLASLAWIPVHTDRPHNYPKSLKYASLEVAYGLATPSEVQSYSQAYVVGSVRPLVNVKEVGALANVFKWNSDPRVEDVANHLSNVVQCYRAEEKISVQYVAQQIYRMLNSNQNYLLRWFGIMNGNQWIWNDEGFGNVAQTVMGKDSVDLRPYRYTLPRAFQEFRLLWAKCSLKERSDMSEVLRAIHEAHRQQENRNLDIDRDIQLSVNILNHLSKQNLDEQSLKNLMIPIKTADNTLSMKPLPECAFCDKEWYQKGFTADDIDDNIFLIHERIPLATAETLQIPSLISRTLGVEALDVGYGQTEPLTRRLKTILRDYSDGLTVLKELIQNADDAGATEIRFVYDERSNDDAGDILLDQKMKSLQGPALWTYNDAVFTDEDFENIVKLSGATKENAGDKIGRFGLGFNAVYNLTDVPSFVSRHSIVFFDPHMSYLGRALQGTSKPGIRLNLKTHRQRIQRLVDQFKPYNGLFGCDLGRDSLMDSYEGTLFRFPLRTHEQASKSEISKQCYDDEQVMKLLELLGKASHHILLYTQYLQKISVFHLAADSASPHNMTELFSIERKTERDVRNVFSETHQSTVSGFLAKATSLINAYKRHRSSHVDSPVLESTHVYSISVRYGQTAVKSLVSEKRHDDCSYWVVSSCMGVDQSFRMALEDSTLVPVGGVAARLKRVSESTFAVDDPDVNSESYGMVFCFLPLPIKYPFPVHINGYFAVHSSRLSLYEPMALDRGDKRAAWNVALIDDAVTTAYCNLLQDLTKLCPTESPYAAWPSVEALKEAGCLAARLYQSLYKRILSTQVDLKVVKVDDGWTHFDSCLMLSPDFKEEEISHTAMKVLPRVIGNDKKAVDIPARLINIMLQTEVAREVEEKLIDKATFYEKYFLQNIECVDSFNRDKLVVHCLFDAKIQLYLKDCVCIPVSIDGQELRCISETVHPKSRLACLFDDDEGVFPVWESGVADSEAYRQTIYDKMVPLGMKKDSLSWEELATRCAVVQSNPDTAIKRTKIITMLMNENLRNEIKPSDSVLNSCRRTRFLLPAKRPSSFPSKWKGDDYAEGWLISSEDGYLLSSKHLVCSSHPVIDEQRCFSSSCFELKLALGLTNKNVKVETAVMQITELVRAADGGKLGNNPDTIQMLHQVYDQVLSFLNKCLKRKEPSVTPSIAALSSQHCILIEKSLFMLPSRCALSCSSWSDLMLPCLAVVPAIRGENCSELLKLLGVKAEFQIEDYKTLLCELHTNVGSGRLSERQLETALHVINQCLFKEVTKSSIGDANALTALLDDLPVPNAAGQFSPMRNLCFNNCSWLVSSTDVNYCHTRIPHPVAEAIGMKTLRHELVTGRRLARPFGQKEPLVRRIKRILESYPFSEDILKEMLQNADDSGATEIRFIRDGRHLPTERLFDNSWGALQGPALCIYNNRSFTEADLNGIQNLGEGSKNDDPTKTGQYGVGFNCVYHITDVPTFLTSVENVGTVLCAFDPNCKYVPGADSNNPGGMFDIDDKTRTTFCDVVAGYLQEHHDVTNSGTVFRLPLRLSATAETSEISNKSVTEKTLEDMFDTFRTDMGEALLFVNSVEEIHLQEVLKDSDKVRTLYSVFLRLSPEAKEQRRSFQRRVREIASRLHSGKDNIKDVREVKEVCYEAIIEDSEKNKDVWEVVQRVGFEDPDIIPKSVVDERRCGNLGCLPIGGVAYLKKSSRNRVKHKNRLFCFLPLPVLLENFPVSVNGHFVLDHESRRNIWTDDKETYKSAWNKCLMEGVIAPAYCTLISRMRDVIHNNEELSKEDGRTLMKQYFDVFPNVQKSTVPYITDLATALYKFIFDENKELLPLFGDATKLSSLKWMSPAGHGKKIAYFDDLKTQLEEKKSVEQSIFRSFGFLRVTQDSGRHQNNEQNSPDTVLRNTLNRCGFILFNCPIRICEQFEKAKVEVKRVNPEAVLDFFGQFGQKGALCKLPSLPAALNETQIRDVDSVVALLKYCMRSPNCKASLNGKPLLLTADLHLRQFDESDVKYVTRHCGVAPHALSLFVHSECADVLNLQPEEDKALCRAFLLQDFVTLLPDLLPLEQFRGSDKHVPLTALADVLQKLPSTTNWLESVWKYIASFLPPNETMASFNVTALLMPLSDWCLLPVMCRSSEMLLPVGLSRGVLLQTAGSRTEFESSFFKLGVAQPIATFVLESVRLLTHMCGNCQQPSYVISALDILSTLDVSFENLLEVPQGRQVLKYFSDNVQTVKDVPNADRLIRHLPFYITIYNKQTALTYQHVYMLPSVPRDGMENWTRERGYIFLKQEESLKDLLEFLGCQVLSETEVYCSFIFEHFHSLSPLDRLAHISFVKDHVAKLQVDSKRQTEYSALTSSLRRLQFLPATTDQHELVEASRYYDRSNPVFQVMLPEQEFPPPPFVDKDEDNWSEFLKICGLISTVTQEMFVQYATDVQQRAFEAVDKRIRQQSEVLLKHFVERKDLDETFLTSIRRIRFILPRPVSDSWSQLLSKDETAAAATGGPLVCFENCTLCEHEALVWTVQHLLPPVMRKHEFASEVQKKYEHIMALLGVDVTPQAALVVKHIRQLCLSLDAEGKQFFVSTGRVNTLCEVLKKVYGFLNSCRSLDDNLIATLSDTPCVCVPESLQLIRPRQFVTELTEETEIKPFLNKFPLALGPFVDLFYTLGTEKKPTIQQYARVLADVHESARDKLLDESEGKIAMDATRCLFHLLEKTPEPRFTTPLYFPATSGKLRLSSELIFEDNRSLRSRLRSFNEDSFVDVKGINDYTVAKCLKKLPEEQRPRFMSSVVFEFMDVSSDEHQCELADRLKSRLGCAAFVSGYERVVRDKLMSKNFTAEGIEKKVEAAKNGLRRINFMGRSQIITYLQIDGERIEKSDKTLQYFMEPPREDGDDGWRVHIQSGFPGDQTFYQKLAEVICKTSLQNDDHVIRILATIFDGEINNIHSVLDGSYIAPLTGRGPNLNYPVIGDYVPPNRHCLLIQDVNVLFQAGWLVALEKDDPMDRGERGTPTFIVVQIVKLIPNEDTNSPNFAHVYRVKVSEAGEEIDVPANALYAFNRPESLQDQAVVLHTMNDENDQPYIHSTTNNSTDLDAILEELRRTLIEAWRLPEDERKRVKRRLWMIWHPDKNPHRVELCTRVFQLLQNWISMLEAGRRIDDVGEDQATRFNPERPWQNTDFDDVMRQRARAYYQQERTWRESYRSSGHSHRRQNWSGGSYRNYDHDEFFREFRQAPNPQPGEARRWMEQARFDLSAAANDMNSSYEWVCQKCFQAAEKALRAAQYSVDANYTFSSSSGDILHCTVQDVNMLRLVGQLNDLLHSLSYLRYPSSHRFPTTPHNVVNLQMSTDARAITTELFDRCQEFIDRAATV